MYENGRKVSRYYKMREHKRRMKDRFLKNPYMYSAIGMEFEQPIKEIRTKLLFEQKVFTGVAGTHTIRLLPPLCLSMEQAQDFLNRLKKCL